MNEHFFFINIDRQTETICLQFRRKLHPTQTISTQWGDFGQYLGLLVTTEFEVLASLQDKLVLSLAGGALQTQNDLLGSLGLQWGRDR